MSQKFEAYYQNCCRIINIILFLMYKHPINITDRNVQRKTVNFTIDTQFIQDINQQTSSSTPQQDLNDQYCFKCKGMGQLYCCDNCNRTYHNNLNCLNRQYIPQTTQDKWICQCCKTRQLCPICEELDGSSNPFICTICERYIHKSCYHIPDQVLNQRCSKNPILKQNIQIVCPQCIKTSGIKKLLSYKNCNGRIFHQIIPNYASSIHRGWIEQIELLKLSQNDPNKIKLVDLIKNKQFNNVDSESKIQKILALKPKLYFRQQGMSQWLNILFDNTRIITFGNSSNFRFLVKWQNTQAQFSTWQDQYVARSNKFEFRKFLIKQSIELEKKEYSFQSQQIIKKLRNELQFIKDPQYKTKKNQYQIDNIKAKFQDKQNIAIQIDNNNSQYRIICVLKFLNYLIRKKQTKNTCVIIMVDTNKLSKWQKLIKKQCYMVDYVIYNGNRTNRNYIRQHQFFIHKSRSLQPNIILTTFNCFQYDYDILSNKQIFHWQCMVFDDEAKYQSFQQMFLKCYSHIMKIILFNNPIKPNYCLYQRLFNMDIKGKKIEQLMKNFEMNHLIKFKDISSPQPEIKKKVITSQNLKKTLQKKTQGQSQSYHNLNTKQQKNDVQQQTKGNDIQTIHKSVKLNIQQKNNTQIHPEQKITQNEVTTDKNQNNNKMISIQQDEIQQIKQQKQNKIHAREDKKHYSQGSNYEKMQNKLQKMAAQFIQNEEQIWKQLKRLKYLRFILMYGIDFKQPQLMFNKLLIFSNDLFASGIQQFNKFKKYTGYFLSFLRFQLDDYVKIKTYYYFSVNPKNILKRILLLSNLNTMYKKYREKPNEFPTLQKFVIFKNKKLDRLFAYSWTANDDLQLIRLILIQGFGNWKAITEKFEDTHNKKKKGVELLKQKLTNSTEVQKKIEKQSYFFQLFNQRAMYIMENLSKKRKLQNSR